MSTETLEQATYYVASQPDIIRSWAYIAHHLGYGWCAGTKSNAVGGDFGTRRVGPQKYEAYANYDPADPIPASHPKWQTRLKMTFDNVTRCIDTSTMEFKKPIVKKLQPRLSSDYFIYNYTDKEVTGTDSIDVEISSTTSHTSQSSFKEGFSIKQKWQAGIPGLGASETELQFNFEATQGWSNTESTTKTMKNIRTSTFTIPPRSKIRVEVFVHETSRTVRYSAKASYDYHVSLHGFLRYDWNAKRKDTIFKNVKHGTYSVIDRPIYVHTFGNKELSAAEQFIDSAQHAHIENYDPAWDWGALKNHPESKGIFYWPPQIASNIPEKTFEGEFKNVYGTSVFHKIRSPEPLSREELVTGRNQAQTKSTSTGLCWKEGNGNHELRDDGTVFRRDGSMLDRKDAIRFIETHNLQKTLTQHRTPCIAHNRNHFFRHSPVVAKSCIWQEQNGNHWLRNDGTVYRANGDKLTREAAAKFVKDNDLEDIVTSRAMRAVAK